MPEWELVYEQWLQAEQLDEESKKELLALKDQPEEIRSRFETQLKFGTGGMRGIIGAGTNRINIYMVRKLTQGLADYLNREYPANSKKQIAIAYDSRYFSREFAEETALVAAGNGIKALIFKEMRPTPHLSFAVREFGCQAGVVITASHNTSEYNGYKVYGEDGGQAATELSKEVAGLIEKVDLFRGVRRITRDEAIKKGLWEDIGEDFDSVYLEKLKSLSLNPGDGDLKVVYTPLHGTGAFLVPRLLAELGYRNVFTEEKQAVPDPAFTTVGYPNPEDKEAFKLALQLAKTKDADLILATDPDADRVGCAVKNSRSEYVFLNGNQVGALLIEYILSQLSEKKRLPSNGTIIKTIVTDNLGKRIAASYGVETMETLTGFKYIGEKMKEFEITGSRQFLFGYEESYGYLAGTFVRDKDAIVTSALLAEMTAYYKRKGKLMPDVMEDIYKKYGYILDNLQSIQLKDIAQAAEMMRVFREKPSESYGGLKVLERRDYKEGKSVILLTGEKEDILLPQSDVLHFTLEGEAWFAIRPSGTEPKIKFYFSAPGKSREEAASRLTAIQNDVLQ